MSTKTDFNEDEELVQSCIEVIRSEQRASVALLQRRYRLGYVRACRIMEELERRGIVGPEKGNGEPRDILIDCQKPEAFLDPARDPFQKAKEIRRGERDSEIPPFEELTGWLQRVPKTWLAALLVRVVSRCIIEKVFQDNGLVRVVERTIAKAKDGTWPLRNEGLIASLSTVTEFLGIQVLHLSSDYSLDDTCDYPQPIILDPGVKLHNPGPSTAIIKILGTKAETKINPGGTFPNKGNTNIALELKWRNSHPNEHQVKTLDVL